MPRATEQREKRLLIVTYHFPPSNVTGTFRLLGFIRHLDRLGWRCAVVTVRDPKGDPTDPSLLERVPAGTSVVRTSAPDLLKLATGVLPRARGRRAPPSGSRDSEAKALDDRSPLDYLSRLLVTPDPKIGWIPFAARATLALARSFKPQALLSSGPPWSAHRAALRVSRRLGLPWVADFRDPWAVSPFVEIPYPSLERRNARLEAEVVREASLVLCNTEPLEESFRRRYPAEPGSKFVTLTNGYDPEDFDGVKPVGNDAGKMRLLHAGVLYGKRDPRGLLDALVAIRDRHPEVARETEALFVGFLREERFDMEDVAAAWGLTGIVRGIGNLGHRDALSLMLGAEALLVLGLTGGAPEAQVPAKVYEYFGAGRFILSLSHPDGAIAHILARSGRPHRVVPFDDAEAIRRAIVDLHARFLRGDLRADGAGAAEVAPVAEFTRAALAARLAASIETLASRSD